MGGEAIVNQPKREEEQGRERLDRGDRERGVETGAWMWESRGGESLWGGHVGEWTW